MAQGREAARVGVEQHLVALAGICHQPERPAGAQRQVRHLRPVVDPGDHHAFLAPVELVGLAPLERQRHERRPRRRLAFSLAPRPHEVRHPRVATRVALRLERLVQRLGRAPVGLGPPRIRRQCLPQPVGVRGQLRRRSGPAITPLLHLRLPQPTPHRIARQTRQSRDLAHRLPLAEMHPPNLSYHRHRVHLFGFPAGEKGSRKSEVPGSVLGRHQPRKWVSFGSAATADWLERLRLNNSRRVCTVCIQKDP